MSKYTHRGEVSEEPGFDAIAAQFPSRVLARIKSWPDLAEARVKAYMPPCACATERPEDGLCSTCHVVAVERQEATANVAKVRNDKDYALRQAELIQKAWSDLGQPLPSRQQIEKWEDRSYLREWAKQNPDRTTNQPGMLGWLRDIKTKADLKQAAERSKEKAE